MGLLGRKVRREGASGLPFLAHLVQKHSSTVSIVLSVLPAFPGPICIKYPPHNLVRATRKKSKEREAALAAIVHTGKLFGYIFRGRYPPPYIEACLQLVGGDVFIESLFWLLLVLFYPKPILLQCITVISKAIIIISTYHHIQRGDGEVYGRPSPLLDAVHDWGKRGTWPFMVMSGRPVVMEDQHIRPWRLRLVVCIYVTWCTYGPPTE